MFDTLPDAPTLRLCSTLASLAYAAVFLFVWRARRAEGYLLLWGGGSALYAVVLVALDLDAAGPSAVLVTLLYGLLPTSNVLLLMGVRQFHGRRPFRPWMLAPVAIAMGCFLARVLLLRVEPDIPLASIVDTFGLAAAMGLIAVAILRHPSDGGARGQRMAGGALLAYVPVYLLIMVIQLVRPADVHLVETIPMIADQVLLSFLNLGLLAMPGERAIRTLREAALRDPLTKAWNRDGLRAQQARLLLPGAAVIAIDLDRFKQINDSYGHAVGDRMLSTLAMLAGGLAAAQDGDVVRLGGDEFVVVIPQPGTDGAQRFASELQEAVVRTATHLPPWTISLGITKIFSGESAFDPALQRADLNLYRAKKAGRNRAAA